MSANVASERLDEALPTGTRDYAIVIDAGSSGSRVHVYSWRKPNMQLKRLQPAEWVRLPVVELGNANSLVWQLKAEPGLSTFADKPHTVDEHLRPLMEFAQSIVPAKERSNTPVYLFATAGVRLVPDGLRQRLLDAACRYIRNHHPFRVDDCAQQIRAITGEVEGVYGWVAANYLLGGFDKSLGKTIDNGDDDGYGWSDAPQSLARRGTFGFMDMGGASTQLVFEPDTQVAEEHRHDITEVRLRRLDGSVARHDVFVVTFLGFGTNQARARHIARLQGQLARSNGTASAERIIHDPCLPVGLEETLEGGRFVGTGSLAECREHTHPLLNKTVACPEAPCLFNGVHTPEIDYGRHRFVGVSDWWYSTHDILGQGGAYNSRDYRRAAEQFCQRDWDVILAEHRAGRLAPTVEEIRLRQQCFKAAWLMTVLHDGFGVPHDSAPSDASSHTNAPLQPAVFQSLDNANGIPFTWTLGAALMHA
ncbi:nucleoside phosphatase GDA1/CD39, partial [Thamnocephalis sphaerospora]